ncbi:MAG: ferrous iron transport protein A [Anaerolineae bacterium]|jgi:Fe2+ transport system protein FeoA|nr:ferrous iron transport protein A [Anaerolineae bacterium]
MTETTIPLAMVAVGETARLESIRGCENVSQRLTALGLTPGVEVSVVQDDGGAMLIAVRDSRVALGRGLANKVMVSLQPAGSTSDPEPEQFRRHRHHQKEHKHEKDTRCTRR